MHGPATIVFIVFAFIAIMAALRTFADISKSKMKAQEMRERQWAEDEQRELLARLEERIEVLERILTDEKFELKRRFRDL